MGRPGNSSRGIGEKYRVRRSFHTDEIQASETDIVIGWDLSSDDTWQDGTAYLIHTKQEGPARSQIQSLDMKCRGHKVSQ